MKLFSASLCSSWPCRKLDFPAAQSVSKKVGQHESCSLASVLKLLLLLRCRSRTLLFIPTLPHTITHLLPHLIVGLLLAIG